MVEASELPHRIVTKTRGEEGGEEMLTVLLLTVDWTTDCHMVSPATHCACSDPTPRLLLEPWFSPVSY